MYVRTSQRQPIARRKTNWMSISHKSAYITLSKRFTPAERTQVKTYGRFSATLQYEQFMHLVLIITTYGC